MQYVYEAIVAPTDDEKICVTFPDWEGSQVTGTDYTQVIRDASALLRTLIGARLSAHQELPKCDFQAELPEGARSVIISVYALPTGISLLLTASDASAILGVTRSRISNMLRANILEEGHRDGRSTVVTLDSVDRRLANPRKPGRPRKNPL